jgi:hypothetical protein
LLCHKSPLEKDLLLVFLFPSRSAHWFSLWIDSAGKWNSFLLLYERSRLQSIRGNAFSWRQDFFSTGAFLLWWLCSIPNLPPPRINVAFSEEKNYALENLSCHSNSLSIDSIFKGSFNATLMERFGPMQEIQWKKTRQQMDIELPVK